MATTIGHQVVTEPTYDNVRFETPATPTDLYVTSSVTVEDGSSIPFSAPIIDLSRDMAASIAVTIPEHGQFDGEIVKVYYGEGSGDIVISPTGTTGVGWTTVTFNMMGDSATFVYSVDAGGFYIKSSYSAVIA